ncbi:MAG: carbohydrate ABC transporter substrate-binding protein, partial [Ruminiclostridium sp.]|nr:carbohydrate ABC transporter substrate-binding protein [Ruminiclostridium sp.]
QCCPSALIYRRSIAKDVLGTDDPDEVQKALDSWDKYDEVAAKAKDKGYYMHASFAETYRVFSNNATGPWVTGGELTMPDVIEKWTTQAKDYFDKGYIVATCPGVWDADKNAEMASSGKAMCFFGPAWYFNFCMGAAVDGGTSGDWAICKGPQAHFWGGTWILAATGTDNGDLVAKVMQAFTENEEVCENMIKNDAQFTNNKKVNEKFASDPNYGSEFLGGQNDVAVFAGMAGDIVWQNATIYDQACNEGYQEVIKEYILGNIDKDTALLNFYDKIKTNYPALITP